MFSCTSAAPNAQRPFNKKSRNLIVCGLPQSVGRDDIHRMFSEVGPVVSTKIMLDVKTGGHRGFGFVLFEHDADAARAKNTLHGLLIDPTPGLGKSGRMRVDFANHDAFNVVTDTTHIFVRNVPPGTTNLDVVTYFTPFGEVVSCSLRKETARPGEPPTMAAFVEFTIVPSAKEAAAKGSGATPFEDKSVPMLVKLAETNDVRAERRLRQQQSTKPIAFASNMQLIPASVQPVPAAASPLGPFSLGPNGGVAPPADTNLLHPPSQPQFAHEWPVPHLAQKSFRVGDAAPHLDAQGCTFATSIPPTPVYLPHPLQSPPPELQLVALQQNAPTILQGAPQLVMIQVNGNGNGNGVQPLPASHVTNPQQQFHFWPTA